MSFQCHFLFPSVLCQSPVPPPSPVLSLLRCFRSVIILSTAFSLLFSSQCLSDPRRHPRSLHVVCFSILEFLQSLVLLSLLCIFLVSSFSSIAVIFISCNKPFKFTSGFCPCLHLGPAPSPPTKPWHVSNVSDLSDKIEKLYLTQLFSLVMLS